MTDSESKISVGYIFFRQRDTGFRSYLESLSIEPTKWNTMLPTEQDVIYRNYDAYSWQRARAETGGGE